MASKKCAPASPADGERAQRPVVDFLLDPATHGLGAGETARIDTHIATVVLAGRRAYKLKRAVKLAFVDFSSLARREAACRAELRLNRRTAPAIYRDVVAVTRAADGGLRLGGPGEVVEWLVAMRRFDDSRLLDRLAARHALAPELALRLAAIVAGFHDSEAPVEDGADAAELERLVRLNHSELTRHGLFDAAAVARLRRQSLARLRACAALVETRAREGRVRHCHGDLHLRNIFLDDDGRPVLFDALEFDERLARIDVLYDLAFLLMDIWHRGLADFANALFNRYLLLTGDWGGLALMPLFLSLRAGIRAHVTAGMAKAQAGDAADRLEAEAQAYLALALRCLVPARPHLIAVGGFSGSGKSTLARGLAPCLPPLPGAVVARSDEIRKRLWGVAPEAALPQAAYAPEVSRRVYAEMRRIAGLALDGGHPAIVDAVHDRTGARRQAARLAERRGVGFHGFWLDAPAETLARRIAARQGDASEATARIMRAQMAKGSRPSVWRHLDADAGAPAVLAKALECLEADGVSLTPA